PPIKLAALEFDSMLVEFRLQGHHGASRGACAKPGLLFSFPSSPPLSSLFRFCRSSYLRLFRTNSLKREQVFSANGGHQPVNETGLFFLNSWLSWRVGMAGAPWLGHERIRDR